MYVCTYIYVHMMHNDDDISLSSSNPCGLGPLTALLTECVTPFSCCHLAASTLLPYLVLKTLPVFSPSIYLSTYFFLPLTPSFQKLHAIPLVQLLLTADDDDGRRYVCMYVCITL